jgi:hypothetical protein
MDMLTAAPVISAASLAKDLDMAIPNAAALLDQFTAAGIAVEVTHRSKQRLFGLAMFAPLWRSQPPGVRRRGEAEEGRPVSETRRLWLTPSPSPFSPYRPWPGNPAPLDHM